MALLIDSVALFNTSPVFCATAFADDARSSVNELGLGSSFAICVTTISSGFSVFSSMITSPDDSLLSHMIEYLLAEFLVIGLRNVPGESFKVKRQEANDCATSSARLSPRHLADDGGCTVVRQSDCARACTLLR